MTDQPPNRTSRPPRKEFAAAAIARDKNPKPSRGRNAQHAAADMFASIYGNAQMLFVTGLALAAIQGGIQGYFWMTERVWRPYPALALVKSFGLSVDDPKIVPLLELVSPGIALAAVAFAVMVIAQLFMKSSR